MLEQHPEVPRDAPFAEVELNGACGQDADEPAFVIGRNEKAAGAGIADNSSQGRKNGALTGGTGILSA